jgi:ribosomal protein L16/L10AE
MGKGTGKLHSWFTVVRPGAVLVEFANLRAGRAKYFMNQISFKLAIPTTIITVQSKTIKLAGSSVTNTAIEPFYLT